MAQTDFLSPRIKLGLSIVAISLVLLWLVLQLRGVLTPFLVAAAIAYVLNPAVVWLERRQFSPRKSWRLGRSLSSALVLLLALLLLLGVLLILWPVLSQEAQLLQAKLPQFIELVQQRFLPWLNQVFGVQITLDTASIKAFISKTVPLQDLPAMAFNLIKNNGLVLLGSIGVALLVPVLTFYFLLDWPHWVRQCAKLVPRRWVTIVNEISHDINTALAQYLRGQLAVMLALAAYYSAALWLAGFDVALPVGVLTGLLIIIPYLGYALGLLLALLAAVLQFDGVSGVLWVLVIYGLGQLLESLYLTPRWVGASLGLNPIAVLFALMAFGDLMGFTGVLLAIPFAAIVWVLLRRVLRAYQHSDFYQQRH